MMRKGELEVWRHRLERLVRDAESCESVTREHCLEELEDLRLVYRSLKEKLETLRSAPHAVRGEVELEVNDLWFALQLGTVSMESRLGLTRAEADRASVSSEEGYSPVHGD